MVTLRGREIVLGVTGSIAAYKAAYLLRELVRLGAEVSVVMTEHAQRFVGPLTFRTLSRRPVLTDLFDPGEAAAVEHVALAERAHLIVVAPATAHTLAKAALGLADDFLTTLLLATRAPLLFVPAMDAGMWRHPTVEGHVAALRARGAVVLEPAEGELASGLIGPGRLPEVSEVVEAILGLLAPKRDLSGERILITAGPTREPVDPVRYLSNRSSGKMGYALAAAALRRGAEVTLVSGPTNLAPPPRARVIPVETTEEMREAVLAHLDAATVVIKAAAVADYRPVRPPARKIPGRQEGLAIPLTPTPDILREVGARKGGRFVVGFAAETEGVAASARAKLEAKGADLMVANDVSRPGVGFESDDNEVILLDRWGGVLQLPRMSKLEVADAIFDRILALRSQTPSGVTP
ncbi:MAG: bifunctional phosphopantothenoylcysteine decarboxylase/phosphopantothenate--cysteine ligase CoaBC [Candidatus Rokubacteria bacterium]|nr:bifunctional phosphopantothenoylcysteine decarboxylase/phosphopantothenate--cysteine ligase CoaBC [Candidatus Rokubacteria bacterium]MBI2878099.1 bifunctional phosphopantothenoylcysteine decarboxylase/phosphopantothenate--cysteine ligase CoaBC [Candidatus Rokubacteria bacterium]